jgi:hypothetical protein
MERMLLSKNFISIKEQYELLIKEEKQKKGVA